MVADYSYSLVWFSHFGYGIPIIDYTKHLRAESLAVFLFTMLSVIVLVCYFDQRKEHNERVQ